MPAPVCLVHGTWARGDAWYRPPSPFVQAVRSEGLELVSDRPFRWSGQLGGISIRRWPILRHLSAPIDPTDPLDQIDATWANDAEKLIYYCFAFRPHQEVSLIAHSHGGNLAAMAIVYGGLRVRHLITMATPVRADLQGVYAEVALAISGRWIHLRGDFWRDWMARLGQFGDGVIGWTLTMPHAQVVHVPGRGHSDLADPDLYDRAGLWAVLRT